MRIRFDYGRKGDVSPELISQVLNYIYDYIERSAEPHGSNIGVVNIYLSMYDENGKKFEIGDDDSDEVGFEIRKNSHTSDLVGRKSLGILKSGEEELGYLYKFKNFH